jgi:UDP-glucose 4-epimerase
MAPDPRSPYAITKLDGEYYCGLFQRTGRLRTVSLRYFNVFGRRQNPHSAYAAAVPIFIHHALRGEALTVYGDGEQTRDFVHVSDVVAANAFLAEHAELSGVYNVGYGAAVSINALAARVVALTGSASPTLHAPPRAGDVRHSVAATQALAAAGFRPTGSFERGLADTVAGLRAEAAASGAGPESNGR